MSELLTWCFGFEKGAPGAMKDIGRSLQKAARAKCILQLLVGGTTAGDTQILLRIEEAQVREEDGEQQEQ